MRRNLQGKRNLKRFFESWPVLIFMFALMIFFTWQVVGFWKKMNDTRENKRIAEEKVMALKESHDKLSTDIKALETDAGVEESIRNKFGLAKEGEGVIIIVEDKNAAPKDENEGGNWFPRLWNKLFN